MKPTCDNVKKHTKQFRRYYALRFFICLMWTISMIVIWRLWANQYFASHINQKISFIIACICILLPWLHFKIWRSLTDRYYEGKVIGKEHRVYTTSNTPGIPTGYRDQFILELIIKKDRGLKHKKRLDYGTAAYADLYQIGDRVRCYPGADYPQIITDDPERKLLCVFCGAEMEPDRGECICCQKKLLP